MNTHIVACVGLLQATLLAFHFRNDACARNQGRREVSLQMAKKGLQGYSGLMTAVWEKTDKIRSFLVFVSSRPIAAKFHPGKILRWVLNIFFVPKMTDR